MNEISITVKTVYLYPSFKWCVEYLTNWKKEEIQKDQKNINQYLSMFEDDQDETEEESRKVINHLVELTHRLTGAEYAIQAIEENDVQDQIIKLNQLISDIEKELEK